MATDEKIRRLLEKYDCGEINKIQLDFWMKNFRVNQNQIARIHRQMDREALVGSAFWFLILLLVGGIACYLIF